MYLFKIIALVDTDSVYPENFCTSRDRQTAETFVERRHVTKNSCISQRIAVWLTTWSPQTSYRTESRGIIELIWLEVANDPYLDSSGSEKSNIALW